MSTAPDTTCRWHIATTEGYTLELKFDDMSISGCHECSCGYVKVRDGSGSSAPSIGSFCSGNLPSVVSSTGNHMFIRFYAGGIWDSFKASINSKETEGIFSELWPYPLYSVKKECPLQIILFITSFLIDVSLRNSHLIAMRRKMKRRPQQNTIWKETSLSSVIFFQSAQFNFLCIGCPYNPVRSLDFIRN